MRVLLTVDPILPVPPPLYGGIERIADALIRHYRSLGHEVGLMTLPESTAATDYRINWPNGPGGKKAIWRNAQALRRAAAEFRPDVVHSFSRLAFLAGLLPLRVPVLMSYQRHTGGWPITLATKLAGRRLAFTGCSEFICGMGRPRGGNWTAIPNFVETEKFTFVKEVPADAPLVYLSRIESIKGPDLAITIARASGRRLILAGNPADSGVEREFFEKEIRPWIGREGIEWIGEVNDLRKNELLGTAAALIVPIRWQEPFGIVFAESLATGTPVISCSRGALPEIIEPGRTGYFIQTVEAGVAAVNQLNQISRADCRRAAETRFSLAACAPLYLKRYEALIHSSKI